MSEVTICQATPGKLFKKKTPVKSVSELRKEASELCNLSLDRFRLVLHGSVIKDDFDPAKLSNNILMVVPMAAPRVPLPAPDPVKVSDDDFQKFRLAFGSALKNPAFTRVARRLLKRENMESLAAACAGLESDSVAQAFLTRPQLLVHLLDQDTIKLVGEKHPALLEAAHNLAAAVHEEAARSRSSGSQATADPADRETESSGAYFLDDVSDDDMDEDDGNDGAGGSQGGRPPAQITAEQLAAALASAASGGGNPFMGVTGMAPQQQGRSSGGGGAGSSQSTAATTPAASSRLTADMFQAAMQTALMGLTAPSQQQAGASPGNPVQEQAQPDLSSQLATMREMGIVDEGLARQALTVMGGDIQAAIELIFSGWLGE